MDETTGTEHQSRKLRERVENPTMLGKQILEMKSSHPMALRSRGTLLDASEDSRPATSEDSTRPRQTAPIALLPPVLVSLIICFVVAGGVKTHRFKNLLKTCRTLHLAGLPFLYQKIEVREGKAGAGTLRLLAGGYTGIDKTGYVKELTVDPRLDWEDDFSGVLEKCLLNARRVQFEVHGCPTGHIIWSLLQGAPVLKELTLKIWGTNGFKVLDGTQFPRSVRLLYTDALSS